MPVYSMTGYASITRERGLAVECRSVNGRFLDLTLKLPEELRSFEPALRDLVSSRIKRGKLELRMSLAADEGQLPQAPSPDALHHLQQWQSQVRQALPEARALSVAEALQLARGLAPSPVADAQDQVMPAAQACIEALAEARAREGQRLVEILLERVALIESLAHRAQPLVPTVVQRQQARFLERWNDALKAADASGSAGSISPQALQERALGEAAAFALRIDVAEELSRLQAHLQEIRRLLAHGGELGKRLDFLIQELHREANTLGSKSAALELTGISVDMKVAIEQMREQVQNIE